MSKIDTYISKYLKYLVFIVFLTIFLYYAQSILVPVIMAMIIALLLHPVVRFFEKFMHRIISIALTFLLILGTISTVFFFFGSKFFRLLNNLRDFGQKIQSLITDVSIPIQQYLAKGNIDLNSDSFVPFNQIIETTLVSTKSILVGGTLVIVYSFLFLLYKTAIKNFILFHFAKNLKQDMKDLLNQIQKVIQSYFFGMLIIMVIVGTLNGLGLMIMGIDYPFLFGYFAALLTIIPYIGTSIGGLLPVIYAAVNYDNFWLPILIIAWYTGVQTLEGNVLTPKIVGSSVSLNPMIALTALVAGGAVWGVAGLILFIPMVSVLKIIFDHIEELEPYGEFMSTYTRKNKYTDA